MAKTVGLIFEEVTVDPDIAEIERLKAYAVEHGIDIGNSSSVNGITKKIAEAEKAKADAEVKAKANAEGKSEE